MPTFNDISKLKGIIEITVKDKEGNFKKLFNQNRLGRFILKKFGIDLKIPFFFGHFADSLKINNTITNAGKTAAISRLGVSAGTTAFTYLAVGIGTTAATTTDVALVSEITDTGLERAAATVTFQLVKQWTATGVKAVTDCGAFNAASGPVLLGRQVFSAVTTANTDTIQCTYKFIQA